MIKIYKCWYCKHYNLQSENPTCKAFPEGIPVEVLREEIDHSKNIDGDNGICFEIDTEAAKILRVSIEA